MLLRLLSTPASGSVAGSSLLICIPSLLEFELLPLPGAPNSSLLSTKNRKIDNHCWGIPDNQLHNSRSSVILLSFAESLSSGIKGLPDELLFLLSFVSLLLLLSLLLTLPEPDAPEPDDDEDAVGSFLMMFVGGEPSS